MQPQIKLYVDRIIEFEHNDFYGLEFEIKRIIKVIFTIFNNRDATDFMKAAMANQEGISYMHTFANLVTYFHLRSDLQSGSIAFFDCLNDINIALDLYNYFSEQGFDKAAKNDFMK